MQLELSDITKSTSTNTDGLMLFMVLKSHVENNQFVKLSLHNVGAMSSSFLNSSFGSLVERYGLKKVKDTISLINYRPSQALYIKNYLHEVGNFSR